MLDGIHSGTAIPALERSLQFMSARQRLLAGNIANAETPGFRPTDVDPRAFQRALRESLDAGRVGSDGKLEFDDAAPVSFGPGGTELKPEFLAENILFHDGNDRSVERLMQRLTENTYFFRIAAQLLRGQMESIHAAIRERP